jgi:hypothetical protein
MRANQSFRKSRDLLHVASTLSQTAGCGMAGVGAPLVGAAGVGERRPYKSRLSSKPNWNQGAALPGVGQRRPYANPLSSKAVWNQGSARGRIIHDKTNPCHGHRGHGAPTERQQEATMCASDLMRTDPLRKRTLAPNERSVSADSVSELWGLCGPGSLALDSEICGPGAGFTPIFHSPEPECSQRVVAERISVSSAREAKSSRFPLRQELSGFTR